MILKRYLLACCAILTTNSSAFAGKGPIEYLLFYNTTRKAVFESERLSGEVRAAELDLKMRQDMKAMADKLRDMNAISQEEYEWRVLDLSVAQSDLQRQQERVKLAQVMAKINDERRRNAGGNHIDLRAFFDLNIMRWDHECRLFEIEAEKEQAIYSVQHKIFERWQHLHGENAVSKSDLMSIENKAQDANMRLQSALKNVAECQTHRPTWEEIQSLID